MTARVYLVRGCLLITCAVILSGFSLLYAEPTEVWIDTSWAGANPGDVVGGHVFGTDAFADLQTGIDVTASNGVVHVAAGVYPGGIHVPPRGLTLRSDAGAMVTIIDGSGGTDGVIFDPGSGFYSVLDGFTIRDATTGAGGDGLRCESSVVVLNSTIRGSGHAGIIFGSCVISNCTLANKSFEIDGNGDLVVEDSFIDGSLHVSEAAIQWSGPTRIIGNRIYGGIKVSSSGGNEFTVLNNLVISYGSAIYLYGDVAPNFQGLIANNTMVDGGISLGAVTGRFEVVNNIFYRAAPPYSSQLGIGDLQNNDFWPASSGMGLVGTNGNVSVPPYFVDDSKNDYHLTDISRCIGIGIVSNAPALDLDGNPRPNSIGSNPDLGAYESALVQPVVDNAHYFGVAPGDYQEYQVRLGRYRVHTDRLECTNIDTSSFGTLAYVVEENSDMGFLSRAWYEVKNDLLGLRSIESDATITFDQPLIFAGRPFVAGTNYLSTSTAKYAGVRFSAELTVKVAHAETLNLPVGELVAFRTKYRLKLQADSPKVKPAVTKWTYWYVPNIGIVQSKSNGQTMVLTGYGCGACP